MPRRRPDHVTLLAAASACAVPMADARRIVDSYFGAFLAEMKSMPLDTPYRIYRRDAFEGRFSRVLSIPSVGRLGPVYSRYLKWRRNAMEDTAALAAGSAYAVRGEVKDAAAAGTGTVAGRPSPSARRIWVIGLEGRRLARQAARIRYRVRKSKEK